MPTITKKRYQDAQNFGNSPYGNVMALEYNLTTNAAGAMVNSDSTAAIASGDVVRVGLLPAGFRLHDSLTIVSTAMTAAVIGNIGFAYEDGVDDAGVPQSATYFNSAASLNAAGRVRATGTTKPVTLPKPAWLTVTTGGAANAKAAVVDIIVYGEFAGT
jgi:hypothetical protein